MSPKERRPREETNNLDTRAPGYLGTGCRVSMLMRRSKLYCSHHLRFQVKRFPLPPWLPCSPVCLYPVANGHCWQKKTVTHVSKFPGNLVALPSCLSAQWKRAPNPGSSVHIPRPVPPFPCTHVYKPNTEEALIPNAHQGVFESASGAGDVSFARPSPAATTQASRYTCHTVYL